MKLKDGRVCMDCDEVFERAARCPDCGSQVWFPLSTWVPSMPKGGPALIGMGGGDAD